MAPIRIDADHFSPDTRIFIECRPGAESAGNGAQDLLEVHVVLNWVEELRARRVPTN